MKDSRKDIGDIDEKLKMVVTDIIDMHIWNNDVNAAIEQLEMVAEKSEKDFKPIIKAILDERERQLHQQVETTETSTETVIEATPETEIKTETPTVTETTKTSNKKHIKK